MLKRKEKPSKKILKIQRNIEISNINTPKINNNNNILIIAKLELFKTQNSSNRLNFLNFLNTKNNIKVIEDSNVDIHEWIVKNNWKPDIILYYFLSNHDVWLDVNTLNLDKINIKKYMIFEDCIYTNTIKLLYRKYKFSKVLIPTYNDSIINFFNNNNINYTLLGYSIDIDVFKKLDNIEKEYDILYYGSHFLPVYPLRNKIYNVLKNIQSNSKYKIKIIEHNSYDKRDTILPIDNELCLLINKSRFCISTSSKYDLLLKKYIEIPLCGTTIIGNIPSKYINQLSGKMVNIDFNANENQIKKIILDALENKYINEENNNDLLKDYMKNNYSFDIGYKKLSNICNN